MNGLSALDSGGLPLRPTLLLAEDNCATAEFFGELLHPSDEVTTVADGEQSWAMAQRSPPGLLLADVSMPHLDGIALTRGMHGNLPTAEVGIILLTAINAKRMLLRALESKADVLLLNPLLVTERLAALHDRMAARADTGSAGANFASRFSLVANDGGRRARSNGSARAEKLEQ